MAPDLEDAVPLATIAHDLVNIWASILARAHLIERATEDEVVRADVVSIQEAAERGVALTELLTGQSASERTPSTAVEPAVVPARVLVVDDEPTIRLLVAQVLARAGYDVITASGAEEALALVAPPADPVDLVVTDMIMPGVRGDELARRVREIVPHARFVFHSGSNDAGHTFAGAVTLPKPSTPEEITRAVAEALR